MQEKVLNFKIREGDTVDRFSQFNPKVCFLFFVLCVILILVNFNPFFLLLSLFSGVIYNFLLYGKKAFKTVFAFLLPFTVAIGIFNTIFTSYGMTILFSIGSKNFTLEGLVYGLCQGVMFSAVIIWLSNYNCVLSADKFMSVFSHLAPNLTLVLTMTLSFIPRLEKNAKEINEARSTLDYNGGKFKKSLDNFSALVSLTLEQSIEVSQSMKARGFNKNRQPYSKYGFNISDGFVMLVLVVIFIILTVMNSLEMAEFLFDPYIDVLTFSPLFFTLYGVFMFIPLIIDLSEGIKWCFLKRKI